MNINNPISRSIGEIDSNNDEAQRHFVSRPALKDINDSNKMVSIKSINKGLQKLNPMAPVFISQNPFDYSTHRTLTGYIYAFDRNPSIDF